MGDGRPTGPTELNRSQPRKYLSIAKKALDIILAQWLVIGFGLSCLLAYFFPGNGS